MENQKLSYIVFLIYDKKVSINNASLHDGRVFQTLKDAKDYALDNVQDKLYNKFIIGSFIFNEKCQSMQIEVIETYRFINDKKNVLQLNLFKNEHIF